MSNPSRADPFVGDIDISDFAPTPRRSLEAAGQKAAVRQVSEAHDFPSRTPDRPGMEKATLRRRRTGRNVQINIKASAETIARFTALADARNLAFGELLERLVEAAEAKS